jgi:hypothetical protein
VPVGRERGATADPSGGNRFERSWVGRGAAHGAMDLRSGNRRRVHPPSSMGGTPWRSGAVTVQAFPLIIAAGTAAMEGREKAGPKLRVV